MSALPVDTQQYLRRVAVSSIFNSASSALATALLLPLVIRAIGMENYGLWAVLGVFIGVASALDFGIWKALVYWLPRGRYSADELVSTAAILCVFACTIFGFILISLLLLKIPIFGSAVQRAQLDWTIGLAGIAVVFCSLLTNLQRGLLESSYRGHIVNIGYAVLTLLLYAVPASISMWTQEPRALIIGSASVYAALLFGHVVYVQRTQCIRFVRPSAGAARAILTYGLRSFTADAPSILLGPMLLYFFILSSSDSAQFGVFDIALKIATLAATALGLLSTPFFALVANATAEHSVQVRAALGRYLRFTVVLAICGWLSYFVVGEQLLSWLFDAQDEQLFRTSIIILAGTAAAAAMEPIARLQMGLAKLRNLFYVRASMLSVALTCIVALASRPPLDRFAIATAAGFVAAATGLLWLYRRERWGLPE
jgi:O-antigen/teichoic acid export membrane protein